MTGHNRNGPLPYPKTGQIVADWSRRLAGQLQPGPDEIDVTVITAWRRLHRSPPHRISWQPLLKRLPTDPATASHSFAPEWLSLIPPHDWYAHWLVTHLGCCWRDEAPTATMHLYLCELGTLTPVCFLDAISGHRLKTWNLRTLSFRSHLLIHHTGLEAPNSDD